MYEPDINEYPPIEEAAAPEEVVAPVVEEEVATNIEEVVTEEISVVEEEIATPEEPPAPRRNRKKKDDNIETVRVITDTRNGSVGVDFRGFGLRLQTDIKHERGELVQVKYEGVITTPDFKAELV